MNGIRIETPQGDARVHLHPADDPRGALILGHGAGGGVEAPDVVAVARAAVSIGMSVALVEQPYRVAGRRAPPPSAKLDDAWRTVVEWLRCGEFDGLPLITGGRSSGARVAVRCSGPTSPGVLCLAFPLHPPGKPEKTRLPELEATEAPVLIIQGRSDPFGMPPQATNRRVVVVAGDHGLKADLDAVAAAARDWLDEMLLGAEP